MRWRVVVAVLLAAAVGYGIGIAQPYVVRPPLVVAQDAVSDAVSKYASVRVADAGGRVLVVEPPDGRARVAFVLYPGGLVRPQAYEWVGRALAAHGVRTLIPEFTADLAVTDAGRATVVAQQLGDGLPVVVGGHSLGGAMAAGHAAKHPDAVAGLVLLAAYPAADVNLTGAEFPVLSLAAEHDGLATMEKVRDGLTRLPGHTDLVVVEGSVHSFFGRYGPQAGDGLPTVSRADAEADTVAALARFFDALP